MTANVLLNGIGILGTIFGFVGLLQTNVNRPQGTYKYRLRAGQGQDQDGWRPEVKLYGYSGNEIAASDYQSTWVDGASLSEVQFGSGTEQISRTKLVAGNNAICVAWHEIYDADGSDPTLVLGETLGGCGSYVYASNTYLDFEEGSRYVDCAWLNNGGGCGGVPVDGWWSGINIWDYLFWRNAQRKEGDPQNVCNTFDIYRQSECTRKRSISDKSMDVITTNRAEAIRMCSSSKYQGQSLISYSEGLFCDMNDHSLHPLCSNGQVNGCFDEVIMGFRSSTGLVKRQGFKKSKVTIDDEKVFKRGQIRSNTTQTTYNFEAERTCDDCCANRFSAPNINQTHYFGSVVVDPVVYNNITGGIYFRMENGTQTVLLDCQSSYDSNLIIRQGVPNRGRSVSKGNPLLRLMNAFNQWNVERK